MCPQGAGGRPAVAALIMRGVQWTSDPADIGRYFQWTGTKQGGDLSDAPAKAWITDSSGTKILARADQNNYDPAKTTALDLSAPYTPGSDYYLVVQNTKTGGSPMKDFYFVTHQLNGLIDNAENFVRP